MDFGCLFLWISNRIISHILYIHNFRSKFKVQGSRFKVQGYYEFNFLLFTFYLTSWFLIPAGSILNTHYSILVSPGSCFLCPFLKSQISNLTSHTQYFCLFTFAFVLCPLSFILYPLSFSKLLHGICTKPEPVLTVKGIGTRNNDFFCRIQVR